jgi:hypothetical protein
MLPESCNVNASYRYGQSHHERVSGLGNVSLLRHALT